MDWLFSFAGTNCFGWHTWSLWEQYDLKTPIIYDGKQATQFQHRQRRHCLVCNKEQDQLVRNGPKE
jgi:nicotinamide riboside transporter PnuC